MEATICRGQCSGYRAMKSSKHAAIDKDFGLFERDHRGIAIACISNKAYIVV